MPAEKETKKGGPVEADPGRFPIIAPTVRQDSSGRWVASTPSVPGVPSSTSATTKSTSAASDQIRPSSSHKATSSQNRLERNIAKLSSSGHAPASASVDRRATHEKHGNKSENLQSQVKVTIDPTKSHIRKSRLDPPKPPRINIAPDLKPSNTDSIFLKVAKYLEDRRDGFLAQRATAMKYFGLRKKDGRKSTPAPSTPATPFWLQLKAPLQIMWVADSLAWMFNAFHIAIFILERIICYFLPRICAISRFFFRRFLFLVTSASNMVLWITKWPRKYILTPFWRLARRYPEISLPLLLIPTVYLTVFYVDENWPFLYCDPCSNANAGLFRWIPLNIISSTVALYHCPRTDALYWPRQLSWLHRAPSFRAVASNNTDNFNQFTTLTSNISTPLLDWEDLKSLRRQMLSAQQHLAHRRHDKWQKSDVDSVRNVEHKFEECGDLLEGFLEFRVQALNESAEDVSMLRHAMEYAQKFEWASWNQKAKPHRAIAKVYQKVLNGSKTVTEEFLARSKAESKCILQLQQYTWLSQQGKTDAKEIYYKALFQDITHGSPDEIGDYVKAMDSWPKKSSKPFTRLLFQAQFQFEVADRVLSGSLEKQFNFSSRSVTSNGSIPTRDKLWWMGIVPIPKPHTIAGDIAKSGLSWGFDRVPVLRRAPLINMLEPNRTAVDEKEPAICTTELDSQIQELRRQEKRARHEARLMTDALASLRKEH